MGNDDPQVPSPLPQSPLEVFIDKLTGSMNGYTTHVKETLRLIKQVDRKIDASIKLVNDSRASDQINSERLKNLLERAQSDEADRRELRDMLREIDRELGEAHREITGEHILPSRSELLAEMKGPPSGLHKGGFNVSWAMLARNSKRGLIWFIAGGGGGAVLYHLLSRLSGHG